MSAMAELSKLPHKWLPAFPGAEFAAPACTPATIEASKTQAPAIDRLEMPFVVVNAWRPSETGCSQNKIPARNTIPHLGEFDRRAPGVVAIAAAHDTPANSGA